MQLLKKWYVLLIPMFLSVNPVQAGSATDFAANLGAAMVINAANVFSINVAKKVWQDHPKIVMACCAGVVAVFAIKLINDSYKNKKTPEPKPAPIYYSVK